MVSNDPLEILNKHKRNLTCDICTKKFWFWQKAVRVIIRTKENVWAEYYHIRCLEKKGYLRRIRNIKAGRWDDKDPGDRPATNTVR